MMNILQNRKEKNKSKSGWVFPSDSATGHLVEPRKSWERILARAEIFQLIELIAINQNWKETEIRKAKTEINSNLQKFLDSYRTKATKLKLDINAIGLRNLRIHDLRRTLGSWMASTGATTVIIGRQLNQKSPAATAIYSRLQQDPVKEARNKAVSAMLGAAGITPSAEPIPIRKKL